MTEGIKKLTEQDFVTDQTAYEEYKRLLKNPILKKRFINASNGKEIDLSLFDHVFDKKIAELPEEEQTKLRSMKTFYRKMMGRTIILKQKAMGGNFGSASMGRSILDNKKE